MTSAVGSKKKPKKLRQECAALEPRVIVVVKRKSDISSKNKCEKEVWLVACRRRARGATQQEKEPTERPTTWRDFPCKLLSPLSPSLTRLHTTKLKSFQKNHLTQIRKYHRAVNNPGCQTLNGCHAGKKKLPFLRFLYQFCTLILIGWLADTCCLG